MVLVGALIIKKSPLAPAQMIWAKLVLDGIWGLAFLTDPPSEEVLSRMPESKMYDIVTPQMWRNIIFNAVYQCLILTLILLKGHQIFGVDHFSEEAF